MTLKKTPFVTVFFPLYTSYFSFREPLCRNDKRVRRKERAKRYDLLLQTVQKITTWRCNYLFFYFFIFILFYFILMHPALDAYVLLNSVEERNIAYIPYHIY